MKSNDEIMRDFYEEEFAKSKQEERENEFQSFVRTKRLGLKWLSVREYAKIAKNGLDLRIDSCDRQISWLWGISIFNFVVLFVMLCILASC